MINKFKNNFSIIIMLMLLSIFVMPLQTDARSICGKSLQVKEGGLDEDYDGYPDFLEKALGYSPKIDDCARHMKCGKLGGDLTRLGGKKNILLILDASGSMTTLAGGGKTRIDSAKEALRAYISVNPPSVQMGLLVYGAGGHTGSSCENINLAVPIGQVNKESIYGIVDSIQAKGLTPIAASLKRAREILEKYSEDDNHVILISDGQESCNGNPSQAIYDLMISKGKPMIDIIGFGVRGSARNELQCLARVAKGNYYDVKSAEELTQVLRYSFDKMKEFYKTMVCINRDFNKYLTCETQKYNKANGWLIQNKLMEKDPKKKRDMIHAEASIKERYFNQVKKLSKDAFQKKIDNLLKEINAVTGSGSK